MQYESKLNRNELIADFEKNCGPLDATAKSALLAVADEMDNLLVSYANEPAHAQHERPYEDWSATVLFIKGKFYADPNVGSNNYHLDCPNVWDAADDLGISDEADFCYEELLYYSDWEFTWTVC